MRHLEKSVWRFERPGRPSAAAKYVRIQERGTRAAKYGRVQERRTRILGGRDGSLRAIEPWAAELLSLAALRGARVSPLWGGWCVCPTRPDGERGPWVATVSELFPTTLRRLRRKLTEEETRELGKTVERMHARGVFHCDLHPDNVVVREAEAEGGSATVRIIDFGNAVLRPPAQGFYETIDAEALRNSSFDGLITRSGLRPPGRRRPDARGPRRPEAPEGSERRRGGDRGTK